ncbi:MAG: LuxR family transcriptional regulator [Actinobacteria bacterium]|nr:LuxR family transcriptional regulator [Actinomycetota bacterium]
MDLTNAQCAVLEGLSLGLDPADVARQLGISENTVRTHERNIHDKYRTILGDQRITRSRLLYEALRDGYWEARPRSRSHS